MSWWRAYDEAVDDPKLQRLPAELFRSWFNLCCLTNANKGSLPPIDVIAFKLRTTEAKAEKAIEQLLDAGLIDADDTGRRPHNWKGRQYKTDVSTERVKRFRERSVKRDETVSRNAPETETETETETEKIKPADAGSDAKRYAFDGGIIRLTQKHFDEWQKGFKNIDLRAELIARDAWLGSPRATDSDRSNWFISTSKYLANRNAEVRGKTKQHSLEGII